MPPGKRPQLHDGLTAKQLADKLGCSRPTIYRRLRQGTLAQVMPTEGDKPTSPLTDNRACLQRWPDAVEEIRELPEHQFKSCWPGIVLEAAHDAGLRGLAGALQAVRDRYGHVGAQWRE